MVVEQFLLNSALSMEFIGDGVLLVEKGMDMTDESGVSARENSFR